MVNGRRSCRPILAFVAGSGVCFLSFVLAAGAALAFSVLPPSQDVVPNAGLYNTLIQVVNTREEPLALELEIHERVFGADAAETLRPADDEFVIFPPQVIVPPGETQTFRIQYLGESLDGQSKSFRLYIGEVLAPLAPDEPQQIRQRTVFGAAIHLVPDGIRAEVRVASIETVTHDGATKTRVVLRNDGGRYVYLTDLDIRAGDRPITVDDMELPTQTTILPPGGSRTFYLPNELSTEIAIAPRQE